MRRATRLAQIHKPILTGFLVARPTVQPTGGNRLWVGVMSVRNACLSLCIALVSALPAAAGGLNFEHVMDIGSEGVGPGQFKYVEDFAFSRDGHLLVTDASHAYVQAFDK